MLAVERDRLPSDQVLSTHTIHPPGLAVLDELVVGDAVRSEAPASPTMRLRKDGSWADITFPDGLAGRCPRRRLDGLLAEAAVAAGVELRDGTRVSAVRFDGSRAVGVRLQHAGGIYDVDAALVVGADGRRSFVAEQVRAEEYMAYDAPQRLRDRRRHHGGPAAGPQPRSGDHGWGDHAALERWWRERDVKALPAHYCGREEGAVGAPETLECLVIDRVARDPGLRARVARLPQHQCSPYDAVPFGTVMRALPGGLARGRPQVISEFLAQGRRIAAYNKVMKQRRALLR